MFFFGLNCGDGIAHCLVGVKVGEEKFRLDIATTLGSEEGFFIFFIFIFKENFWGFFFPVGLNSGDLGLDAI